MLLELTTSLDAPLELAWQAVKKPDTFRYVTGGLLSVSESEPWPERWGVGESFQGRLYLLGVVPAWRHCITIVELDETRHLIRTEEHGGPLRGWNHLLHFEAAPNGRCRYTDRVQVRAGLLTLPIWLFAQGFFRYRQFRWRKLARRLHADGV
ncbi:MAG: hypothetical protein DWQ37_10205 [Planctomycetota bacterium]|nr:MAG: hypothetical protein DWQ37_10205 [Planctomycetota bacterium]